jgi:hypothetical protein
MGKKAKVLVGLGVGGVVLMGAALAIAEWQLKPAQMTPRVNALLAEAGIGGSIGEVGAGLDGIFRASGIDLSLTDGTRVKAESVTGEAELLPLLGGKVRLATLEVKGVDVKQGHGGERGAGSEERGAGSEERGAGSEERGARSEERGARSEERGAGGEERGAGGEGLGLGRFAVGKLAAAGRVTLADGTELRFNARSEGIDFSKAAELRAGLAWTGFRVGGAETDPRADVAVSADFRRTLGDAGPAPAELAADLARLRVRLNLRDASALALGGPSVELDAEQGATGLAGKLLVKDAKGLAALEGEARLGESVEIRGKVNVATEDLGVLAPREAVARVRLRGEASATVDTEAAWSAETSLTATWPDLGAFSAAIPKGSRCEWKVELSAAGKPGETVVRSALVDGEGGFRLKISKPLVWRGGPLPADSSGAPVEISAGDAPLRALAPFLAAAGVVPVAGTWSGSAEIAFAGGEAVVSSPRALALAGMALEREGKAWLRDIDLVLPLRADRGGLSLENFQAGVGGRSLVSGSASVRPRTDGGWEADGRVRVDLGDLAGQPGWEDLPFERLRGTMVEVGAAATAPAGKAPVVSGGEGRISRGEATLLRLRQRAEITLGEPLPQGALAEARAEDLPLETVAALVPGLGLAGTLEKADVTIGSRSDGSWYVRSESGPLRFARAGVSWAGTPYLRDCELSTEIDLAFGERSVLKFEKTDLRSGGRTLASGGATVPLGGGWPTGEVTGELGAIAQQPFAGPLAQLAGGNYRLTVGPAAGGVGAELTLRDAGFRDRALRVNAARLRASARETADGDRIEGAFRLGAGGVSEGTFGMTRKVAGKATRWDAKVDLKTVVLEDLIGLAPPEEDPASAADPATIRPDAEPIWAGHTGTLEVRLGLGTLGELRAETVTLLATLDKDVAKVASLTGTVLGGTLVGEGTLAFNRTAARGPYVLAGNGRLAGADLAQVGKAIPGMEGNLEGKVDARLGAASWGQVMDRLGPNLALDISLDSAGGRARLPRSAAAISEQAGEIADIGLGVAALTAAFGKGRDAERAARVALVAQTLRELQKAVTDYRFSKLELRAARQPDGTLRVTRLETVGEALGFKLSGAISPRMGAGFADWPMDFAAELRGGGILGQNFTTLGYDAGLPTADGMRQGPAFAIGGTFNDIRTNLLDALRASPRAPADRTPPPPTQGAPTGPRLLPFPFGR